MPDKNRLREQGRYNQTPPAQGDRNQPQNVVRSQSPRKKAPPSHPTKTPAPVKKKGPPAPQKNFGAVSSQESAVRKKVKGP